MAHGDLNEFREHVREMEAMGDVVVIAKAAHLLDRLLDEHAQWQLRQLKERAHKVKEVTVPPSGEPLS